MRNKHAGGAWEKDAGKVLLRVGREIANLIEQEGKTMEAKHTPGPWGKHKEFIYHGSLRGGLIAQVYDRAALNRTKADHAKNITMDQAEANARLIAAAPELLEALEEIAAMPYSLLDRERGQIFRIAEKVIIKARGEA